MNRNILSLLLSTLFIVSNTLANSAYAQVDSIQRLAWMGGCWSNDKAEAGSGSGEQWMQPAAGSMFGVGRMVRGGKTISHEFMRITSTPEGKLSFIAQPDGQAATTFTQISLSDSEVVFENAQHDFPQRVIYRKLDTQRMLGRIEGTQAGKVRGIDFPMTKNNCDMVSAKKS